MLFLYVCSCLYFGGRRHEALAFKFTSGNMCEASVALAIERSAAGRATIQTFGRNGKKAYEPVRRASKDYGMNFIWPRDDFGMYFSWYFS